MSPVYYSRRRLSPFLGTLQVVDMVDARAHSVDGVQWELRLLSVDPIPTQVWGNIGPRSIARRWYRYGRWSREGGEERTPVNPVVGDPRGHPGLGPLRAALGAMPGCPFAAQDSLELWLLDRETALPVALQSSLCPSEAMPAAPDLAWQATTRAEAGFPAPGLARLTEQRPAGVLLNEFVRQRTGGAQWFRRDADGSGQAVSGIRVSPDLDARCLESRHFPDTPVTRAWQNELAAALVADYSNWLAPLLLTLPGLSRERRDQLEQAAVKQALLLDRIHRVIPAFVDRPRIEVALVEAAIRKRA